MDGQTDERTNISHPVFYRIVSPAGALPCFLSLQFAIMQSRATGITDHILTLGDCLKHNMRTKRREKKCQLKRAR